MFRGIRRFIWAGATALVALWTLGCEDGRDPHDGGVGGSTHATSSTAGGGEPVLPQGKTVTCEPSENPAACFCYLSATDAESDTFEGPACEGGIERACCFDGDACACRPWECIAYGPDHPPGEPCYCGFGLIEHSAGDLVFGRETLNQLVDSGRSRS